MAIDLRNTPMQPQHGRHTRPRRGSYGDKKFRCTENLATAIPRSEVRGSFSPATHGLDIIVLESGSCSGDDAIVHFQDYYRRSQA